MNFNWYLLRKPCSLRLAAQNYTRKNFDKHLLSTMADEQEYLISEAELTRFGEESLEAVGANHSHAKQHIKVLVEADRRGHYSHGFNRLSGHYVAGR